MCYFFQLLSIIILYAASIFFCKISFKVTFQSFTVELLYNINTELLSSFVYNYSFNSVPNVMKRIWVIITICSVIKKTVNAKCLWISTAVAKSEKIRNFTCLSCVYKKYDSRLLRCCSISYSRCVTVWLQCEKQ